MLRNVWMNQKSGQAGRLGTGRESRGSGTKAKFPAWQEKTTLLLILVAQNCHSVSRSCPSKILKTYGENDSPQCYGTSIATLDQTRMPSLAHRKRIRCLAVPFSTDASDFSPMAPLTLQSGCVGRHNLDHISVTQNAYLAHYKPKKIPLGAGAFSQSRYVSGAIFGHFGYTKA